MKNILGNKLVPTKYQKKIIKQIKNKNALVTMPTNSGKTLVAYKWADVLRDDYTKIIFTAPIKALSNERYRELNKQGLDVGLVTGDVKWNPNAQILCMTQEIYHQFYYTKPAYVIIDEFHYIFNNFDRARCYIESITNTHPKSKILLMSATCKKPENIKQFLENLTGKKFSLATSNERLVPLEFDINGIQLKDIKDSLVFCFSRKSIEYLIREFYKYRNKINAKTIKEISKLAVHYNIKFFDEWEIGISRYHGKLLPKEKMFIEFLYRHGYIDTVVGTDALSLGVNLPAKYVVLAQLYKQGFGFIKPSEFNQMVGRAGRYGQSKIGIATWLKNSPVESKHVDMKNEFIRYTKAKLEDTNIMVDVDNKALIAGRTAEEEALMCDKFSYPGNKLDYYYNLAKQNNMIIVEYLNNLREVYNEYQVDMFKRYITSTYLSEWSLERNLSTAKILVDLAMENPIIDLQGFLNIIENIFEIGSISIGEYLQELLLIHKYFNNLKYIKELQFKNNEHIKDLINDIDYTIFRPDLSIE
ncbi:MAG TPA: hypothetical protein DER56_01495 [Thermosipho africanus]|nr:hypothetical protein [Thermosipho africanus]